ncbi:MAG: transposase [Acidobacteriia bacterium]|nr:transposase [Terriglobia bacterium]
MGRQIGSRPGRIRLLPRPGVPAPQVPCVRGIGSENSPPPRRRARRSGRLERLPRYAGRPAVATERLSLLPDGRLLYHLKRRWRDGTTHVIFEPLELLRKLAALVPPPRFHLVRYSGILAPAAAWRPLIIPDQSGAIL